MTIGILPNSRHNRPAVAAEPDSLSIEKPPAIVLGGGANALSAVRSLGRMNVPAFVLNGPKASVNYSRFARPIRLHGENTKSIWAEFLLGENANHLHGSVLIPANDDALELLIEQFDELRVRYRLDLFVPAANAAMLDKLETYRAARRAGVPTPRFWVAQTMDEIERLRGELVFPLLLKPLISHTFAAKFGVKYLVANNFDELQSTWASLDPTDEVMLVEKIPGSDGQLCSYYTYIDQDGQHLFQFTKRIVRRFPPQMGIACRHVTDWIPELVEPARCLFAEVGLRGLANVEFKLDPRDGVLKIIECNARLTAANALLAYCGYDLTRLTYERACGRPGLRFGDYKSGIHLWDFTNDLRALYQLRQDGGLTTFQWICSNLDWRVISPIFQWNDPLPSLAGNFHRIQRLLKRT